VAASFLISIIGVLSYIVVSDERFLSVAVFGFAMMLPLSLMFSKTKQKNIMLIYAIVMAFIGISAIGITFTTNKLMNVMSIIFIFGFVAFQWIANYLLINENNH